MSKVDREHDFHVIVGSVVSSRKLRWICRKHSNDVARQVEILCKSTILSLEIYLVARYNFHVASELTLHYYFKTLKGEFRVQHKLSPTFEPNLSQLSPEFPFKILQKTHFQLDYL